MPTKIIQLDPQVTPQEYFQANQELGVVPDGTGLQILFKIADEYYVVAGPRSGTVLTVNGGAIENVNKSNPFLVQLQEEFEEETFGIMNLARTDVGYQLSLKGGSTHALTMLSNQTFLDHKPGKFAYITFTAVCETLSLEELNQLASTLTPTASFWNKIGNHLFPHTRNAPKDASFADYWKSHQEARTELLEGLVKEYNQLNSDQALLIDPIKVFGAENIEDALNKLNEVANYDELSKLFKNTVGRYSERSGYHVFKATDLLQATIDGNNQQVNDVTGQQVAVGIFNKATVNNVFPTLNINVSQQQQQEVVSMSLGRLSAQVGLFSSSVLSTSTKETKHQTLSM